MVQFEVRAMWGKENAVLSLCFLSTSNIKHKAEILIKELQNKINSLDLWGVLSQDKKKTL